MTGNKIDNKGGMYFAAMIQINNTIQKLDFADCDLVSKTEPKQYYPFFLICHHRESKRLAKLFNCLGSQPEGS